jgi:hypothetical protein
MQEQLLTKPTLPKVPSWVPEAAIHYLAHIESGASIRALARRSGRHASTAAPDKGVQDAARRSSG